MGHTNTKCHERIIDRRLWEFKEGLWGASVKETLELEGPVKTGQIREQWKEGHGERQDGDSDDDE